MTMPVPNTENRNEIVARLRKAGAKHDKARTVLDQAREALDSAVLEAIESGVSESEVARLAGISRLTVRRIQGKAVSRSPWPKPQEG